jgi:IMP dehydrogenase
MPRGTRVNVGVAGTLEEVLFGPALEAEGQTNLMGALRHAMATCGYVELKDFQRIDVVINR